MGDRVAEAFELPVLVLQISHQFGPRLGQLQRGLLALGQQLRLPTQQLGFLRQLHKDGNLRPHELRDHWLDQIVHGAYGVPSDRMVLAVVGGGQKQDGSVTRFVALPNEGRSLEAVHLRHFDVQEDDREIVSQQPLQRLASGFGANQVLAEPLQHRLQRHQVGGLIVDEENVDAVVGQSLSGAAGQRVSPVGFNHSVAHIEGISRDHSFAAPLPRRPAYRYSHTRSSDRS